MKKYLFLILSISLIVLSITDAAAQNSAKAFKKNASLSVLNGAWQKIWQSANGTDSAYCVMHNGFFTIIGKDSTGAWVDTHAGTYDISNNLYRIKILYSSHPDRIGLTHWMEFRLNRDTLDLNFFKKLINAQGEGITGQMKGVQYEEKYIRVKKASM